MGVAIIILMLNEATVLPRRLRHLAVLDLALTVMEDADLCIRLTRLGRGRLVNHIVITGDRLVAAWGALRANWSNLRVGIAWGLGRRKRLSCHYPDVR